MKRLIAAIAIAATVVVMAPAQADPVDEARQRVADFYNQKVGCDAYRPVICPGPLP